MDVQIRWMIRRDLESILDIESKSFEFPWTEDDFLLCMRQRNCIGMVAEQGEMICGCMIYELLKNQLHVLNFVVAPWCRREKVGSQMVDKLIGKLFQQRRQSIHLEVRETNLGAQLFFRNRGFEACSTIRGHYADTEEDAYVMRYDVFAKELEEFADPRNRLAVRDDQ